MRPTTFILKQASVIWVVFISGVVFTFLAWYYMEGRIKDEVDTQFEQRAETVKQDVTRIIKQNIEVLYGLQAQFYGSDEVTRAVFQRHVFSLRLDTRHSGIQAHAFIRHLEPLQIQTFEQDVQQDRSLNPEGYPFFSIAPEGRRDNFFIVDFIEPMVQNQMLFGKDLAGDTVWRQAIERVRDEGKPTPSGCLYFSAYAKQSCAFAMMLPVYQKGAFLDTVADRREMFLGAVVMIFNMDELIRGALSTKFLTGSSLTIYTGISKPTALNSFDRENLLFSSHPFTSAQNADVEKGVLRRVVTLSVGDGSWHLVLTANPVVFRGMAGTWFPLYVLMGGFITTLLLTLIVAFFSENLRRTRFALAEKERWLATVVANLPGMVYRCREDSARTMFYISDGCFKLTGFSESDFMQSRVSLGEMIHSEDKLKINESIKTALSLQQQYQFTYRLVTAKGVKWIWEHGQVVRGQEGVMLEGYAVDVTIQRKAEEALRLRERAITASGNGIIITKADDPDYSVVYMNPACERITGYTPQQILGKSIAPLMRHEVSDDASSFDEIHKLLARLQEGGVLLRNYHRDGSIFWNEPRVAPIPDESGEVTHFVWVINDVTDRISYQQELEYQSSHDALTGLANRNLLDDRLEQAILYARRNSQFTCVLLLDLDHFKMINDSLGHGAGDTLLKEVAQRLMAAVRKVDTVARLGGDEFVVVITEMPHLENIHTVATKLLDIFSQPFILAGQEIYITTSIGAAIYPKDGAHKEILFKNADAAMYRSKEEGRNSLRFYAQEMNAKAVELLKLQAELRRALSQNEFVLYYQPRICLVTGQISGMEALIRWQHPDRGLLSPAQFIPTAEDNGLIIAIDEWVLNTACTQLRSWQQAGYPSVNIAINLSVRTFQQAKLVHLIRETLENTCLSAKWLELELTESTLMHDPEVVSQTLHDLKQLGIGLALDDFGTGYSSLSYLKRFPFDFLKIDRSFIMGVTANADDAAIVRAIITMAHSLGLRVIAEGVENIEQMQHLHKGGCDEFQGYYFSRPLIAAELVALLSQGAQDQRLACL